ncbi:MAG TPA: carboxypeptidase-like regulatory domain-containing protein, partial [Acidobacteriaceae bacterium]
MTYSRTNLRGILALALVAVLAFACTAGHAQEVSGSISGTVSDTSGAVVKAATVVVTNTAQNRVLRTVTTTGSGFYTVTSLPVGMYSITITAPKFSTYVVKSLPLHANDALTVNGTLKVGTTDTVVVTADQLQINLENA